MPNNGPQRQGWVPVPDPTTLTTNAVALAMAQAEKLFDVKLAVVDEKFAGVNVQFTMRDIALSAALKSAQELVKQQNESNTLAIDKASAATTKQIDALAERIDDLKERLQTERGSSSGGRKETIAYFFAALGGLAALGSLIGLIVTIVRFSR
jgi:hypothetical protein